MHCSALISVPLTPKSFSLPSVNDDCSFTVATSSVSSHGALRRRAYEANAPTNYGSCDGERVLTVGIHLDSEIQAHLSFLTRLLWLPCPWEPMDAPWVVSATSDAAKCNIPCGERSSRSSLSLWRSSWG